LYFGAELEFSVVNDYLDRPTAIQLKFVPPQKSQKVQVGSFGEKLSLLFIIPNPNQQKFGIVTGEISGHERGLISIVESTENHHVDSKRKPIEFGWDAVNSRFSPKVGGALSR
jgi:hypothetical protein